MTNSFNPFIIIVECEQYHILFEIYPLRGLRISRSLRGIWSMVRSAFHLWAVFIYERKMSAEKRLGEDMETATRFQSLEDKTVFPWASMGGSYSKSIADLQRKRRGCIRRSKNKLSQIIKRLGMVCKSGENLLKKPKSEGQKKG